MGQSVLLAIEEQKKILLDNVKVIGTEQISLKDAAGRVMAEDVIADADVPPFDRSPYDGYALRSEDVKNASHEQPAVLEVLEEIPAGGISHFPVTNGTAVRIMTGAPIPEGADCIIMYERTEFTETQVKVFDRVKAGENIVKKGEDVCKGTVLAKAGSVIDAGLLATLAGQNEASPRVYKVPRIGIITTGSELTDVGEKLENGMIYDSNRYTLIGTIKKNGCEPVVYGIAGDEIDTIAGKIIQAADECDMVLLTGGVSAGDFDYTPAAMEKAGAKIFFRGARIKPGMACAYGELKGRLICALSGNPSSSIVNFLVLAYPALRKLRGLSQYEPEEIEVTLKGGFGKASKGTRYLFGKLDLSDGTVRMDLASAQGNVIISSSIGCNVMAVVPAGSGPLEPGTKIKAFII